MGDRKSLKIRSLSLGQLLRLEELAQLLLATPLDGASFLLDLDVVLSSASAQVNLLSVLGAGLQINGGPVILLHLVLAGAVGGIRVQASTVLCLVQLRARRLLLLLRGLERDPRHRLRLALRVRAAVVYYVYLVCHHDLGRVLILPHAVALTLVVAWGVRTAGGTGVS